VPIQHTHQVKGEAVAWYFVLVAHNAVLIFVPTTPIACGVVFHLDTGRPETGRLWSPGAFRKLLYYATAGRSVMRKSGINCRLNSGNFLFNLRFRSSAFAKPAHHVEARR
jgi:hypothetical protein